MAQSRAEKTETKWEEPALIALTAGVIFSGVFQWSFWIHDRRSAVVSTQDVGEIISAEFLQGLTEEKTRVLTTRGTFSVNGAFQAFKGNGAGLEVRGNGDKYLCDTTTKTCKKLVS